MNDGVRQVPADEDDVDEVWNRLTDEPDIGGVEAARIDHLGGWLVEVSVQEFFRQDHPDTVNTRSNIAYWTGECRDPAGALRLFQDLLPDLVRVLGPDHFSTLTVRSNIAGLTGECGDPAGALRLFQDLLPDLVRVLGPDHPGTLSTRSNIASRMEALSTSTPRPDGTIEAEDPGNADDPPS